MEIKKHTQKTKQTNTEHGEKQRQIKGTCLCSQRSGISFTEEIWLRCNHATWTLVDLQAGFLLVQPAFLLLQSFAGIPDTWSVQRS